MSRVKRQTWAQVLTQESRQVTYVLVSGFGIRVLPCGLWRANHAFPRRERPIFTPVDAPVARFAHFVLKMRRSLTAWSLKKNEMFCESLNIDIFVKPRRRANFETYDTALDGHCATRAFAVYAAPVLPVVVEFGFRVRGVRVSQW